MSSSKEIQDLPFEYYWADLIDDVSNEYFGPVLVSQINVAPREVITNIRLKMAIQRDPKPVNIEELRAYYDSNVNPEFVESLTSFLVEYKKNHSWRDEKPWKKSRHK